MEDFKPIDQSGDELGVQADEYVNVLKKDICGWWFAQNKNGESGWVPANFLEEKLKDKNDEKLDAGGLGNFFIALEGWVWLIIKQSLNTFIYRYDGITSDELSFPKDAILELVLSSYDGWPTLKYNNQIGRAPLMLLELWNDKKEKCQKKNDGVSKIVIKPEIMFDDIGESHL